MILLIECIALCLLFFLMCYLGTGTDLKNIKNFDNFSIELKTNLENDPLFKDKIKKSNPYIAFVSNLVLFLILFFVLGIFIRTKNYLHNFLAILIMGESLNLFDFLIIDILWFRNSKRVRISKYPDSKYYNKIKPHFYSFLRAVLMYLLVSLIDGALLLLF